VGGGEAVTVRAIRLPGGNLLLPVGLGDPEDGIGRAEIGPDHPAV
jgi:hypothetical protein